jgi:hypothetical protein
VERGDYTQAATLDHPLAGHPVALFLYHLTLTDYHFHLCIDPLVTLQLNAGMKPMRIEGFSPSVHRHIPAPHTVKRANKKHQISQAPWFMSAMPAAQETQI